MTPLAIGTERLEGQRNVMRRDGNNGGVEHGKKLFQFNPTRHAGATFGRER